MIGFKEAKASCIYPDSSQNLGEVMFRSTMDFLMKSVSQPMMVRKRFGMKQSQLGKSPVDNFVVVII